MTRTHFQFLLPAHLNLQFQINLKGYQGKISTTALAAQERNVGQLLIKLHSIEWRNLWIVKPKLKSQKKFPNFPSMTRDNLWHHWKNLLRDAFQIKKRKTFRHLSKFQHTPPSLPHFWQFSILTKNSGSYPLPPSVNLDKSLFFVNVNSTHLSWQKQSNLY